MAGFIAGMIVGTMQGYPSCVFYRSTVRIERKKRDEKTGRPYPVLAGPERSRTSAEARKEERPWQGGVSPAADKRRGPQGRTAAGLSCHDAGAVPDREQPNQIAAKAHTLQVMDVQRYDEAVKEFRDAVRTITEAVVLPEKRK